VLKLFLIPKERLISTSHMIRSQIKCSILLLEWNFGFLNFYEKMKKICDFPYKIIHIGSNLKPVFWPCLSPSWAISGILKEAECLIFLQYFCQISSKTKAWGLWRHSSHFWKIFRASVAFKILWCSLVLGIFLSNIL